jgi:integrase
LPLVAQTGEPHFPELSTYLDTLDRLGVPIVLMQPKPLFKQTPGPAKPFLLRTARTRVRRAAKKAGLPDWLTFAACRHGGLTELCDAELTESGTIALSGHRTADAARGYVKRTEAQREAGL